MSTQTSITELGSTAPGVSAPFLPEVHNQMRMGLLQGSVEVIFAGLVPSPTEAEELPHLVWLGDLNSHFLILLFIQHQTM